MTFTLLIYRFLMGKNSWIHHKEIYITRVLTLIEWKKLQ
jgi:hypothetical protein